MLNIYICRINLGRLARPRPYPSMGEERGVGKRGDAVKRVESRFLEGRLIVPAIGFRTVFVDVVRTSVTSFRRRYRRSSARLLTFYENVRQQVALDFNLGSTGLQRRTGM